MGRFYDSKLISFLTVMIYALFITPYIGIQLSGAGYIFDTITEGRIAFSVGATVMMIILIIYVWVGGIRAVAWTDTFQGIFMFIGILLGSYLIISNVSGSATATFQDALARVPEFFSLPGPAGNLTPLNYLSRWVTITIGMALGPHIIIRMFTAKSLKILKWASILGALYLTLIYWFTPAVGALAQVISPDALAPDQLMVDYLWAYTPIFFAAVLLAGGFAASMSTADSQAHAVSATLATDFYKKYINKDASSRQMTNFTRWMIVVLSLISLYIALTSPQMLVGLLAISTGGIAQLAPAFIGSLYWRGATRAGALTSIIVGILVVVLTEFFWVNPFGLGVLPGFWGLVVGTILFFEVSSFTEKVDEKIIEDTQVFARKVIQQE